MTRDRSGTVQKIEIGRIRENTDNIRVRVTGIERLARSVAQRGILVPIVVHQAFMREEGKQDLELIFGHRRLQAAHRVGLATVPGQVLPYKTPDEILLMMLTEREREPHEPAAIAAAVRKLRHRHGMDPLTIAERMGTSQAQVAAWLNGQGDLPDVDENVPTPTPRDPRMNPVQTRRRASNPAPSISARRLYDFLAQVDGGDMEPKVFTDRVRAMLKGWEPTS